MKIIISHEDYRELVGLLRARFMVMEAIMTCGEFYVIWTLERGSLLWSGEDLIRCIGCEDN